LAGAGGDEAAADSGPVNACAGLLLAASR